jgi:ribosome-binding protein aMBF1 (putative translation factor)
MSDGWKSFQDLKPVVLTKSKANNSNNTSVINKSNIHINKPKIEDDDEAHRIIKYSQDQIEIIKGGRNALCLTQKELAQKCNLDVKIINDIEKGGCPYNAQQINIIARILNTKIIRK